MAYKADRFKILLATVVNKPQRSKASMMHSPHAWPPGRRPLRHRYWQWTHKHYGVLRGYSLAKNQYLDTRFNRMFHDHPAKHRGFQPYLLDRHTVK